MRGDHKDFPVPVQQADATLSQDNPTSGTKYTVLDTVKNARITCIFVEVTWSVQPSPLEVHVTIDGIAIRFYINDPESDAKYLPGVTPFAAASAQVLRKTFSTAGDDTPLLIPFMLEGRSIKIEVETTGGTVSNITARVKYARW